LPAIYTQILALAKLNPLQYYLYLLLYILIYILPSLIVFIVAMTTLRAVGFSSKYARWSNLIGGIIILLLGILLIFRPGLVMFG
jgi:cytochrome c biogenesis protein CcdA